LLLPKRVGFKPDADDFTFFECVFANEPVEDCISRIKVSDFFVSYRALVTNVYISFLG